jgi:hypothetical protein
MTYIDKIIANCEQAKTAEAIQTIVITNGSDLAALDGIQKAIYVIEEINGNQDETYQALALYKGKEERACPKLNEASNVMYVGSSSTGVKKRIEQHIGNGPRSTYALHLSHWFNGYYKITVTQYDVTNEVLQILEDDLSDRMAPAFGKRGGNNR